jgi:hypothetical protein
MATTKRRWPYVLAGLAVFCVVAVIALAVVGSMFLRDNVQVSRGTGRDSAETAFETARRQFPDPRPLLVLGEGRRLAFSPGIESRRNPGTVASLHILAWDAGEDALATVTVPMWLLRMKSGPIVIGEYVSGMQHDGLRLEPKDLDRYGPGVVLEFEAPDGNRVLLTAQ